jgi:predicted RNase H-like HicB family nuclease/DNA-binding XRE family transcriptional regulator
VNTYAVVARRSGKWWALEVPDVPGAFSQARTLTAAPAMARDAIATLLDVDPHSFDVTVTPVLDPAYAKLLDEAKTLAKRAEKSRDDAARTSRGAVEALVKDLHMTQREAAQVMGVSFQRVSQLLKERDKIDA